MKKILLFLLGIFMVGSSYSQVGINTTNPHASTVLDVESTTKGVLLPSMTTAQKNAISNPAPGLLVYDTTSKCLSQNAGTAASPVWICLSQKDTQSSFFYMPSVAIDASAITTTSQTLDLYNEYRKQFVTNPPVSSAGAPPTIPYFPLATDLYYYITKYDNSVLKINSVSASGVLNYDIIAKSGYASFMNVVFVVK